MSQKCQKATFLLLLKSSFTKSQKRE